MVSAFDRLDRRMSKSVERAFGETVRFIPWKAGEYTPATADPDREAFDLRAVVTVDYEVERMDGDRNVTHSTPSIVGGAVRISVDAALFTDNQPRHGDRFQAVSRAGQPVYEVIMVAPDNATRILLRCTKVTT